METLVLPYTVIDKQFVHKNYKYTKLDVEGVSELVSWKKKTYTVIYKNSYHLDG